MKRLLLGLIFACFIPACLAQDISQTPLIEVYFSPKGGCTEAVVRELDAAKTSVLVQAYSFTSTPIAKALLMAHKRGVKVEVILDKSQRTEKYSEADFLVNVGIPNLGGSGIVVPAHRQATFVGSDDGLDLLKHGVIIDEREGTAKPASLWHHSHHRDRPHAHLDLDAII